MPEFSRKKSRFSGKNNEKRETSKVRVAVRLRRRSRRDGRVAQIGVQRVLCTFRCAIGTGSANGVDAVVLRRAGEYGRWRKTENAMAF